MRREPTVRLEKILVPVVPAWFPTKPSNSKGGSRWFPSVPPKAVLGSQSLPLGGTGNGTGETT
jgi:hypothetical protein